MNINRAMIEKDNAYQLAKERLTRARDASLEKFKHMMLGEGSPMKNILLRNYD